MLLRICTLFVLAFLLFGASAPVVPPASVVNNASFAVGTNPLAPGSIAAIFGSNLDDGTNNPFSAFGSNGALLTSLGGASVTFNGIAASVFSAFPGQLNVQIPEGLPSNGEATLVVTVGGQASAPQTVPLGSFSPGIFSLNQKGSGQGAIQVSNTSTYAAPSGSISGSASRGVKPGEFITIYCTGLGAVTNPPSPGKPASGNPLSHAVTTPKVTIGGENAAVSFAGLSPGYVGLYQVNAQIPADASGGNAIPVQISLSGVSSNTVTIAVDAPAALSGNKITGSQKHTCAVNSAGGVICWGGNNVGQLGNGTTTKTPTPVAVSGLSSGVAGVSAGQDFTCALMKTGTVKCWGVNTTGNLGNGTTKDSGVPVDVLGVGGGPMTGVIAIAAGQYHVCAVTVSGAVLCWGDNTSQELGPEANTGFRTGLPYQVTQIPPDMVSVAAGSYYTCALTSKGAEWCWGQSGGGQLGGGPHLPNNNPVPVLNVAGTSPLGGIASIAAGYANACAITTAGAPDCWGENQDGELGNAKNTFSDIPVQVLNIGGTGPLGGIASITMGEADTCALTTSGGVLCWGASYNGDLGNSADNQSEIPVQVTGLTSGVIEIASGYRQNCAILATGGVMCWGIDAVGQLGDGQTNDKNSPVAVLGVGGAGLLKLF
ncbi:MAG TPA: hypothetical protein VKT81_05330 [Bryobacteraceae bacterium]|nr:hypothetical protein [Bryobacteraceae bacterium]